MANSAKPLFIGSIPIGRPFGCVFKPLSWSDLGEIDAELPTLLEWLSSQR